MSEIEWGHDKNKNLDVDRLPGEGGVDEEGIRNELNQSLVYQFVSYAKKYRNYDIIVFQNDVFIDNYHRNGFIDYNFPDRIMLSPYRPQCADPVDVLRDKKEAFFKERKEREVPTCSISYSLSSDGSVYEHRDEGSRTEHYYEIHNKTINASLAVKRVKRGTASEYVKYCARLQELQSDKDYQECKRTEALEKDDLSNINLYHPYVAKIRHPVLKGYVVSFVNLLCSVLHILCFFGFSFIALISIDEDCFFVNHILSDNLEDQWVKWTDFLSSIPLPMKPIQFTLILAAIDGICSIGLMIYRSRHIPRNCVDFSLKYAKAQLCGFLSIVFSFVGLLVFSIQWNLLSGLVFLTETRFIAALIGIVGLLVSLIDILAVPILEKKQKDREELEVYLANRRKKEIQDFRSSGRYNQLQTEEKMLISNIEALGVNP